MLLEQVALEQQTATADRRRPASRTEGGALTGLRALPLTETSMHESIDPPKAGRLARLV